jgi:S1-C subfamily serine protease
VATNSGRDVAVIQIAATGLQPVIFANSNTVAVGDAVIAIGNSLALSTTTPTVTTGIVSALGRTVTASNSSTSVTLAGLIQTDAPINLGNSGGGLFDASGHLIGMVSAVANSLNGSSAQNVGFAIAANALQAAIENLIHH